MKIIVFITVLLLVFSSAFAANFQPTVLKISAPSAIQYEFGGATLEVPVTVSGTPALGFFCVYTKDQGSGIGAVRNGYLGWHYVNKIDTSVYISSETVFDIGSNTVTWDGKDDDGNAVPKGEYSYYIFGFDNVNPKTICTSQMSFSWNEMSIIQIMDVSGTPLVNPVIWEGGRNTKVTDHVRIEKTHRKWVIGGDPDDATLVESTTVISAEDLGSIALDPTNYTMFWKADGIDNGTIEIRKYLWVPNGESEIQTEWGDVGVFAFGLPGQVASSELHMPITTVEGGTDIFVANHDYITGAPESELIYVDMETGEETTRVDLADWWVDLNDGEQGGQAGGGPSDVIDAGASSIGGPMSGLIHLSAHGSCVQQLLDPYRDGEVGGDINDLTLWVNENGDYIGDHNFEEDSVRPWTCNDYNPGPYKYWTATDKYGFAVYPSYNIGATSFGLFAPDGDGIGRYACATETASNKYGHRFLQYGSAYDGMYQDGNSTGEGRVWTFLGHSSTMGTITSEVAVAEDASAFSVAQNAPNPFNPSTTISFTIPDAGTVSIDVFNVAGQRVDTIVSEFMNAGSHSVTWDASALSAGVYFYTVKTGDFSKTMKMTMLK